MHQIRNIYHQYSQPENRLTHALVQTLARDDGLARGFLAAFVPGLKVLPKDELCFSCQRFPGQEAEPLTEIEAKEEEAVGKGIPDFWIYQRGEADEGGWAVFCECKVTGTLQAEQLKNHAATAHRLGFSNLHLLTITPSKADPNVFPAPPPAVSASSAQWSEIYEFIGGYGGRDYARDFLDYMHVMEGLLMADKQEIEPLTKFTGVPFGTKHPYSDVEAKAVLRALMRDLRPKLASPHPLRVDPAIQRRPLRSPWDVMGFEFARASDKFTSHPHFTVSIEKDEASIQITLPNAAGPKYWRNVRRCDSGKLRDVIGRVVESLAPLERPLPKGLWEPRVLFYVQQVHFYAFQHERKDARLEVDVSTFLGNRGHPVKSVPAWLDIVQTVLRQKPQANFEMELQIRFPCVDGSACRGAAFVDVLVRSAEALQPFVALLTGESQA